MNTTNNASNAAPAISHMFIGGERVSVGDDVRVEGLGIARVLAFDVGSFCESARVHVLGAAGRACSVSVLAVRA